MTDLATRFEKLPELLAERAKRYRVPGAALAVLHGDEVFETATGVLSHRTGVEATPDSVFQIGSITKVFTTTLMLQLVDEGRVELDAPVCRYLPDFRLADPKAAAAITIRQLLTHTSGMDGDYFLDTGRGDDCVERFVLACSALPQLHAPGEGWSYCNSGFAVAGRVIEVLRGQSWDRVLREQLLEPIGNDSMGTLPEEAILHRAAVGHLPDPDGAEPTASPIWVLQRSNGPAGATPFGTAADLLRFAKLHLERGVASDGTRVLSESSVREMQREQVALPPASLARAWGLGWMLFDWGGERVIGHDGGTIGQSSFLRLSPESGTAVALLTNGGNTGALYRRIFEHVFAELLEVRLPPLPEANPEHGLDLERYVGVYGRLAGRVEVKLENGVLVAHFESVAPSSALQAPQPPVQLEPVDERVMVFSAPGSGFRNTVGWVDFDAQGRPHGLMMGRLHPRVG